MCQKQAPLRRQCGVIRAPTTWSDCHNHGERRWGMVWAAYWFLHRLYCSFRRAGWRLHRRAGVNTAAPVGHVGKKKKVCGLFLLPWLTLLSCPRLLPSPCVTVLSYAWGRLISNRQTQLSAPLIMRLFVLGDDLGHGPDAHALCRMYGTLRCRRKAINVPLSSVIWGGEIKG